MKTKLNYTLSFFLSTTLLLMISFSANSQGILDRMKRKAEDAINKKIDKVSDDLLNGKKKNTSTGDLDRQNNRKDNLSGGRPKLSELKDEDFIQNITNPPRNENNTRYRIAKNLIVDIKGKYPEGYSPKWRFINYNSNLSLNMENWVYANANTKQTSKNFAIGEYNGKAVIALSAYADCQCYADIIIKDSITVLTETPQTFEIKNFSKILNDRSTGEPCISAMETNNNNSGGWGGKITLSANSNGDITMSLMLENYSKEHMGYSPGGVLNKLYPSAVSYRYIANNINIENEMSAEKAIAILREEKEAKQRQKDYITKTTQQADFLQKVIAKKYTQKNCIDCFVRNSNSRLNITPTTTAYTNGYGERWTESGTDWDVNTKLVIKNKCNYSLLFIGIQQLHDAEKGYYLKEVNKTMDVGYSYSSDQGIMSSLFTSMIGGGSEFNIVVQDKYYPGYAAVGAVQWIKVVKK